MADTRQIVSWALESKCAFRSGDHWFLPNRTCTQLADLRTVASAEGDGRIVNGICVTSWTTEQDNAGKVCDIPRSGFRVEDRLGPQGGLSKVLATCAGCEANADFEFGIAVAGCFGHLDVWPDSEDLDRQLWGIIERRKLEDRLRAAFPVTTPLWHGFWINSPLRRAQTEFLHELLDAACDYGDPRDKDIRHFLKALEAAIRWELPVHVSLAPLGHTDFGWYTIFPHCPRCKANACVGAGRTVTRRSRMSAESAAISLFPMSITAASRTNSIGMPTSLRSYSARPEMTSSSEFSFVTRAVRRNR